MVFVLTLVTLAIYAGVELLAWLFRQLALHREVDAATEPITITLTPTDNIVLLAGATVAAGLITKGLPIWWAAPFAVYVLFVAVMDAKVRQVYDLVQLIMIVWQSVALVQLVVTQHAAPMLFLPFGVYALFLGVQMQQRCCGFADILAYIACGLFISNVVLVTSSAAVLLVTLVYLLGLINCIFLLANLSNFGNKLRLRQPVAFIPAIALGTAVLTSALI